MSNEIPTIIKLNNLREALDSHKGKIDAVELNSFDWWELASNEHFGNYFKITSDTMGNQFLNEILLCHRPMIPRGSFYFKAKL